MTSRECGGSAPSRTLLVTNDFPPRPGGIQAFVHELALRQPPGSLVVYASSWSGTARSGTARSEAARVETARFDAAQPFPVVRYPGSMLLPTPAVARTVSTLAAAHHCTSAWFGAAAPLGLLAPALRRAGVARIVAQTHGHEVGWAALPGARSLLRRIATGVDAITYLGEYTRSRLASVMGGRSELHWLAPGVDGQMYHPGVDGDPIRLRYSLGDRPVVVCVSRLVPRKGQDQLIAALPAVRSGVGVGDAALLLVGGGRDEARLRRLAARVGVAEHVVFTGVVAAAELPAHYAAGDVFAMPCRTRRAGLDVEGLGIVYLEASATGLPVLAGDSGGAPDAVKHGETGYVVNGRDTAAIAARLTELLADPARAARLGQAGRVWVEQSWRWDTMATRMNDLLRPKTSGPCQ
ncbi:MAG: glycosyltransferase family 4 protein [Mycobacteriales bacterium]